ncbi:MAG: DNA gyrase inhibitor YacG [Burkholderiaceae bacterium]|nr:DNA gyrase inhibitor YacG [Burkholderiaceae bacterium]
MTARVAPTVECPRCRRATVFDATNRWRPFCSQRCKAIDLGAWASGAYVVAGAPTGEAPEQVESPAADDRS